MNVPSVQGCFESTKIPGKGNRKFKEVWVWLTPSQVVRAAWAAAAVAFGFLEFVVDASAAAAGAWIVLSFPESVHSAAAAWMSMVTLGGSLSTSFQLTVIVFAGTAMFSSVFLFCGRTASGTASGCGTLVFAAAALELPDVREVAYSVLVGSFAVLCSAAASVGSLTFVVDNPQRVDVVQQQAAAARGHYAFQAKVTQRVDLGDLLSRQASFRQWDRTKNLAGKMVVVRGFSGLDEVSLVVGHVESLTGVPRSLFCLVGASGRRLKEDVTLVQSGTGPDSSLYKSARLKGRVMRHRAPSVPNS